MTLSVAKRILRSRKPFVFFHTHEVTRTILQEAIENGKSMDLDVCVDEAGRPYLGHSKEYYEKMSAPWDESMPIWEAVESISQTNIPVMVDCKHFDAWHHVEEVISRIGQAKCLVHTFITEFDFHYLDQDEYKVKCEWSAIERLKSLKSKFPAITTTASARGLPSELLVSDKYVELRHEIRALLIANQVDTVCLNVPDNTFSDEAIAFFSMAEIIPHVMIDKIETGKLSETYIGETDRLNLASVSLIPFESRGCNR
jgi:hypothetical protein